ncbi:MAG: geranylgeranylglycerol-phosphate geranylgeranyltransferase [Chitinophagales bacterium]
MPYIKIIRPINLLMIAVTQLLFWFCIIQPIHKIYGSEPNLAIWQLLLLILSTVLIAAGGYVINDYYDLPIDLINKPGKVIVSEKISDENAFNYFSYLTGVGLIASLIVAITLGNYMLVLLPLIMASLLWFYAQSFKRMFLVGNLVVSIATAAVIFILIYFEINWKEIELIPNQAKEIMLFGSGYMAFVFVISMLRELVKDLQDRKGDEEFEAKTIPIVLGESKTKIVAFFWILLLIFGVVYIQKDLKAHQWLPISYMIVFIQLPAVWLGFKLIKAKDSADYGAISNWVKGIMFFGMISMIYIGIQLIQYEKTIDSWL